MALLNKAPFRPATILSAPDKPLSIGAVGGTAGFVVTAAAAARLFRGGFSPAVLLGGTAAGCAAGVAFGAAAPAVAELVCSGSSQALSKAYEVAVVGWPYAFRGLQAGSVLGLVAAWTLIKPRDISAGARWAVHGGLWGAAVATAGAYGAYKMSGLDAARLKDKAFRDAVGADFRWSADFMKFALMAACFFTLSNVKASGGAATMGELLMISFALFATVSSLREAACKAHTAALHALPPAGAVTLHALERGTLAGVLLGALPALLGALECSTRFGTHKYTPYAPAAQLAPVGFAILGAAATGAYAWFQLNNMDTAGQQQLADRLQRPGSQTYGIGRKDTPRPPAILYNDEITLVLGYALYKHLPPGADKLARGLTLLPALNLIAVLIAMEIYAHMGGRLDILPQPSGSVVLVAEQPEAAAATSD
ncbi:hypothetical protein GPECTOR_10g933 [Gonium pectorale]|uniref:Uncharacterized protein n=1 Tax=Gonium pectorale TaxID=33097 RepID=A0A150GR64_GONPE|nr:hypothetical protein GPECTOR_10g933 [Gonium pectorale]|eukprot:KXZ52301.1 hypothetical protein GPECTOR_10g933 [Gonium pectorale]